MNDKVAHLDHAAVNGGTAAPPVAVRDLTKIYGAITAVDRISFSLEQGTTVALLGGNGAGKTTTIAMLLGLVVPTSGEARLFGADIARDRWAVAQRMNFQSPYIDLPMRLTVRQNLTVYAGLYGVANADERIAYPARRPGSAWPRRSSTRPNCSCSTSRPPRSIPTPRIGSGIS